MNEACLRSVCAVLRRLSRILDGSWTLKFTDSQVCMLNETTLAKLTGSRDSEFPGRIFGQAGKLRRNPRASNQLKVHRYRQQKADSRDLSH